jgi:fasciclin domain-containing protein
MCRRARSVRALRFAEQAESFDSCAAPLEDLRRAVCLLSAALPSSNLHTAAMLRRRVVAALVVAIAAAGCSGGDHDTPERAARTRETATVPVVGPVTGPLCDLLPSGDDPGAPASLRDDPADVALQWIPVLTTFEAAVRASGLARYLHRAKDVTILAPTDDAFAAAFDRQRLDDLLLSRKRELRALLEAHIVDGSLSLAALRDAGRVTTVAGDTLTVTPTGAMARFGDRVTTVCADYDVANGKIHVIGGVLR